MCGSSWALRPPAPPGPCLSPLAQGRQWCWLCPRQSGRTRGTPLEARRGVRLCTFLLLQPQPRGASWVPGALWVPPRPPTRWQSWPDCVKVACLFQLVVFIVKGSRGICEMFLEVEGMVRRASEGRGHHAWAALASSDTPAPRCRCTERAWSDRGQAGSTRCPQALPRELGDHV